MTENFRPTVLRAKAWESLKGKWNQGAVVSLALFLIMDITLVLGMFIPGVNLAVQLFIAGPITIGTMFVFLDVFNSGKEPDLQSAFEPFNDYARYIVGYLLYFVYIMLWSMLLMVPGIIKSISYAMTFYIMRENPEMKGEDAIQKSMAMMEGHKMDYFLLQLSFIGWMILGMLALGIGLLWVIPYIYTANAAFYKEVKAEYEQRTAGAQPQAM